MSILEARKSNPNNGGPSFTMRNRVYRALWRIVWLTLASWTPVRFVSWRRFILRIFGAKIERGAQIHSSAMIWSPMNLVLRQNSCVGPRVIMYSMAMIDVGENAIVSQGSHICTGSHRISDPDFQLYALPINIGARAWIAAEAFVGPGVRIGDGAVLGARGCAFTDLLPWSVYAGNPAKKIKDRVFDTNSRS